MQERNCVKGEDLEKSLLKFIPKKALKWLLILGLALITTGCIKSPPSNPQNICQIFEEYPSWYFYAKDAQQKWGMPIPVQMAIIHQESHFVGDAKPPRKYVLGFIPWGRVSSAYGYSQALDQTWAQYQASTDNTSADRDDFEDSVDFIAWYGNQANQRLGISESNAYAQYLAFHEGLGGYERGTYRNKPWLMKVSWRVQEQANTYARQLAQCQGSISKPLWMYF